MARPIAPTPSLDPESSDKFLSQVVLNLRKKTKAIPTPKANNTINRIMTDARRTQERTS